MSTASVQARTAKSPATAAAKVTPAPQGLVQRQCACGGKAGVNGECEECRKKRLSVQRKTTTQPQAPASANPTTVPPIVSEVVRSPGRPLEPEIRTEMETRFVHDFSRTRIHTDARAAASARAVAARAYTVGSDIAFDSGQYAPATPHGWYLLAHELAHVAQQSHSPATFQPQFIAPEDHPDEQEADRMARAVVDHRPVGTPRPTLTPWLWRAKDDLVAYSGGAAGTLSVLQAKKPIFSTRAVSGHPGRGEHERNIGPIPTGSYRLHPQRTRSTVSSLQSGTCGANAIASGYQEITSNDPSPCSSPPSHYCTVSCPTAADPARKCFTPKDCWGEKRIKIEGSVRVPVPGSRRKVRRSGFYIHGGNHGVGVTSGCVKVFDNKVFDEIRKLKGRVPFCVGTACPKWLSAALFTGAIQDLADTIGDFFGFGSSDEDVQETEP